MPIGDGGVDHGWPKYGNPNAQSQQQAQYNQAIQQLQEALKREQTSNQTIQTLQAQCQQLIQQGQISNLTIQLLQTKIQQLSQKDQTKDINLQELNAKINDLIEENKHPYDKDLLKFSQEGDVQKSAAALLLGANIEATNSEGQTPLFLSLINNHLDVVNVLLDLNANVDVTDKNNRSILNMLNDLISSHIKDHNLPRDLIKSVKKSLQRHLLEEVKQLCKEPSKESVDALSQKITQASNLIRLVEKADLKASKEIYDTVDINSSAFVKNEGFYKSNSGFFKQPEIFSAEENEHPYSNKM